MRITHIIVYLVNDRFFSIKDEATHPCKTMLWHRAQLRSLASLKPEISQALDSLLKEICTLTDAKILHATTSTFRPSTRAPYDKCQQLVTKRPIRSCPLCKQAGRNDYYFLSKCTYLPADDRAFLTKASLYEDVETEDSDSFHPP